jgi:hypothetical protein
MLGSNESRNPAGQRDSNCRWVLFPTCVRAHQKSNKTHGSSATIWQKMVFPVTTYLLLFNMLYWHTPQVQNKGKNDKSWYYNHVDVKRAHPLHIVRCMASIGQLMVKIIISQFPQLHWNAFLAANPVSEFYCHLRNLPEHHFSIGGNRGMDRFNHFFFIFSFTYLLMSWRLPTR